MTHARFTRRQFLAARGGHGRSAGHRTTRARQGLRHRGDDIPERGRRPSARTWSPRSKSATDVIWR